MFDGVKEIMKECRPKVIGYDNFVGVSNAWNMVMTSTNMTIIKNFLNLLMGEAMTKYGVQSALV